MLCMCVSMWVVCKSQRKPVRLVFIFYYSGPPPQVKLMSPRLSSKYLYQLSHVDDP